MSNAPKTPDWNHIRAFLATAETGSLSAAARQLGLTQPTLSRQVAALEEDLGILLFERVGRTLELTSAGVELLDHTKQMGEAANLFALTASGQSQSIEGEVRITASDMMSAYILPQFLRELEDTAPNLKIDVIAANDIRDLLRREADIAIRHVRPEQPDLIAKLVVEANASLYGADSYLQRYGTPTTREDLKDHRFISYGDTAVMLQYLKDLDIHITDDNFHIGSENGLVAWQYALEGFGLSIMDDLVAQRLPAMRRLVTEEELLKYPVWLATHQELHTSRRIRLVFDMLSDYLKRTYRGNP